MTSESDRMGYLLARWHCGCCPEKKYKVKHVNGDPYFLFKTVIFLFLVYEFLVLTIFSCIKGQHVLIRSKNDLDTSQRAWLKI